MLPPVGLENVLFLMLLTYMTIKIHAITSMLGHVLCGNLNLHLCTRVTCFTENELSFISFEAKAVFYYNSLYIYDLGAKKDFLNTNGFGNINT